VSDEYDPIRDAIATVVGDGAFVTRYVVEAEVVDADGEASVHHISDADLLHHVVGLLHYGLWIAKERFEDDDA
jgi:hypothetical protein